MIKIYNTNILKSVWGPILRLIIKCNISHSLPLVRINNQQLIAGSITKWWWQINARDFIIHSTIYEEYMYFVASHLLSLDLEEKQVDTAHPALCNQGSVSFLLKDIYNELKLPWISIILAISTRNNHKHNQ